MPEIITLGHQPNGKSIRGYEVDFGSEKEGWGEYHLSNGSKIRIKPTLRRVFVLVGDNDQPLTDSNGDPLVVVNGSIAVVSAKQMGNPIVAGNTQPELVATNAADFTEDELDVLIDSAIDKHAWLLDELAKR